MMFKTHLVFALTVALIFLPYVKYPFFFIPVLLIASLLPDIDSSQSYLGQKKIFRPLQWFVKHREVFHSFSFCFLASLALALYFPLVVFPFFLGYSSHLFGDAISKEGIRPFWPSASKLEGPMRVGGKIEEGIFYFLIFINIFLFLRLFY